jgi:beta-glucosidase
MIPRSISPDDIEFRDLNGNGVLDPFEDPRRTPEERTADLVGRLSIEEKVGLMFQTVIEIGPDGSILESPGAISKSPTTEVVVDRRMNHFNVHQISSARLAARWNNAIQELAEQTPHGIPVTISTDPRHAFIENSGVSFAAGPFSQWPDALGLAALDDVDAVREFARIARDEYRAVGIRSALHPQIDLASEPRWARQLQTFGANTDRIVNYTAAYLDGFQGAELGPDSVACTAKHFPGGGPQKNGEDAHFPYGREQVYPGEAFEEHLRPFRTAIKHGTAGMMPYYGAPQGLVLDGDPIEEVGFGYNRQILTGLLRDQLGYDGVIVTDWELVNDNWVGDQVLPARAWGVEHLDARGRMLKVIEAGADQFGGEQCTELLIELVRDGLVTEERLDESVRRILLVKFQLGLFDDPYVDENAADQHVGTASSVVAGRAAQSRSVTVLENHQVEGAPLLPLRAGTRVYLEGISAESVGASLTVVEQVTDADVAIIRIGAPFELRDDLFLERYFHQGSLEFRPGLLYRLRQLADTVPLHLDVSLDRPAILTPLVDALAGLSVTFGVSDEALIDALTGVVPPLGVLPVELPRSMNAVRASQEDVPADTRDPLYPLGFGRRLR